jgi:hypothetical protein
MQGNPGLWRDLSATHKQRNAVWTYSNAALSDPNLNDTQSVYAEKNVIVLLDTDAIAELIAGIPVDSGVTTGPDALDAHPECTVEGEVAIGWSTTSNDGVRRLRIRRKITPKTTARMIPPMTPPAMAGVLDLRAILGGRGVGVVVALINSGLSKDNEGSKYRLAGRDARTLR